VPLDPRLADAVAASRATWPDVELPDAELAAFVAARAPGGDVEHLCLRDLWLACAISRGDRAALNVFEQMLDDVSHAVAHLNGGSALLDDVRHAVRDRVLAADAGGKAKILDYRGRGDLRGWLRVVAVREALQLLRARRREAPLPDDLATRLEAHAPAMSPDEQRVFRDAFAAALATLTPRDRNLLRQQYIYGATIDELAVLYAVHRATAARWLAQIRDTLHHLTRRHVGEALRLTGTELDSAMGRVAEHVDYSLRHTLSREG
jgi:RNA polymerase sigma-70 factor, ECF subfamily